MQRLIAAKPQQRKNILRLGSFDQFPGFRHQIHDLNLSRNPEFNLFFQPILPR
jgi:hypothetical protein